MMNLVERYRVVTFVPEPHLEKVIEALRNSQMLGYGNYTDVLWFSAPGTEQFKPLEGSNPTQGETGKTEILSSVRLEFSIERDDGKLKNLLNEYLLPTHPWEEPVVYVTTVKENFQK
ncbi:MAG: hypothetical protein MRY79_07705 [Alphaproteobacteria bacterium]|nr:hypothetical protein [Alphaproteobacteria bacterium]